MKKIFILLVLLSLVNTSLSAENYQQQIELRYERGRNHDKSPGRSLQADGGGSLDFPSHVFCCDMVEEQGAGGYIKN